MAWNRLKDRFRPARGRASQVSEIPWIEAADNPWGVRLLDVRPVTLKLLCLTSDPQCARNVISLERDDGTGFIDQEPPMDRVVDAALRFPIDRFLAEGIFFTPRTMEHHWALFYHRARILCVWSSLRELRAVAHVEVREGHAMVTKVRGYLAEEDEAPDFTVRAFDFLMRSHALQTLYPVPLPPGIESAPKAAALWCLSTFGNLAMFATPHAFARHDPENPLRTHSMLHIAVARGDVPGIEASLAAGVPIGLLAGDGLPPLQWALDVAIMSLLLERGSPVDVRSSEGATPLMTAVQSGALDQVSFLLDHGADVDAQDLRGVTALHRAAVLGHREVLALLLDHGASPAPEADGHTPRSLAEGRGDLEIVALLERYGGTAR